MNLRKKEGFFGEKYLLLPVKSFPELTHHTLVNENYITEIGFYPEAKFHYIDRPNGAEENIFLFCTEGHGIIEVNEHQQFLMKAGDIYCIPAYCQHRYYSDSSDPWSLMWFHFSSTIITELSSHKNDAPVSVSDEKMNRIQNHFIDLFTLLEQKISLGNLVCASNFLTLILAETYLMEDQQVPDKQNKIIANCIEYMNNHADQNLTLDELAKYAGISISYLNKLFKLYTNKSPIEYFISIKITQACNYIKLTDLKFYEIAERLGYHDQFYFSKLFKRVTGKSPKKYKEDATYLRNTFD